MHAVYVLSVWLHVMAAITWIGGMLFLMLVAVPWLRRGDRTQAARFLKETGPRLRNIGWICFAIVLVTGTFNLYVRGVRFESFADPDWRASGFGRAVLYKLGAFALVVVLSAVHDFVVGPRATDAVTSDPRSPRAARLRLWAVVLGRTNVVLALTLVALAVVIVRGWPW